MAVATVCVTGFLLGVVSHLRLFKHGDWDRHSPTMAVTYASAIVLSPSIPLVIGNLPLYEALLLVSMFWICYFGGLFGSIIRYRILTHPLRNFPGPFLAKVTGLWSAITSIPGFQVHKEVQRLHQVHGDFVRIGPREISVNHVDAIRDIHGPTTSCVKGEFYDMTLPGRSLQMSRDKSFHSKRRKLWDRGFSVKALKEYEPRVVGHGAEVLSQFKAQKGKPVEIARWMSYYSFDVMGDLAFGKSFNMVKDGDGHYILNQLEKSRLIVGIAGPIPWLFAMVMNLPMSISHRRKWVKWCASQTLERKKLGQRRTDLFSYLLDDPLEPTEGISDNLVVDSELAIVAGSDTTTSTLVAIVYLLTLHPDKQKLLQKELDQLFSNVSDMSHYTLATEAPILEGCVNEGLRLYSAVPSGLPRQTPPQGAMIAGKFIPGDMVVSVPSNTIHRAAEQKLKLFSIDPRNFTYPDDFIPERWSTKPELIIHKDAFAPFSTGPYGCAGKALALMELRTLIALIFRSFSLRFSEQHHGDGKSDFFAGKDPGWRDYMTARAPETWVVMEERP